MIDSKKIGSALFSLNTVIVLAREMAYDGKSGKELAEILDIAEYLPRLLAQLDDGTSDFREYLVQLSNVNKRFALAVERFDKEAPAHW